MKTLFETSSDCIRQNWHLYDESTHAMINDLIVKQSTDELIVEAKTVFDSFKRLTGRNNPSGSGTWQRKAHALKEMETFLRLKLAIDPSNFHFLDKNTNQLTNCLIYWKPDNHNPFFQKIQWRRLLRTCGKNYHNNLSVISKNPQTFREFIVRFVQRNLY